MFKKIKLKRGKITNLPILDEAELAFTTDFKSIYVGSDEGNIRLLNFFDKSELQSEFRTTIDNLQKAGERSYVNNADILELIPGHYEADGPLRNSPIPVEAYLNIDVYQRVGEPRKQFLVTHNLTGDIFYRTIHTEGTPESGTGGWRQLNSNISDWVDVTFEAGATQYLNIPCRYRVTEINGRKSIDFHVSVTNVESNTVFFTFPPELRTLRWYPFVIRTTTGELSWLEISATGIVRIVGNNFDKTKYAVGYFTFPLD